jgi:hypothetical protein
LTNQTPIDEPGGAAASATRPTVVSDAPGQQPASGSDGATPAPMPPWYTVEGAQALVDERPDVAAGVCFIGGFLFATILRRLAG